MYIKRAQIDNFGKFHQKTVHFSAGLNVVYGENESGKSTLHSFLLGVLFGMEKQRAKNARALRYQRYEPWNASSYYMGSLDFEVDGKEFTIERNFYHKEKTARLYNRADGEELSVEHGDLEVLLGGVGRRFYENTYCISQAAVVTETDFAQELQQQLMNHAYGGEAEVNVNLAEKLLESKRRQVEQRLKNVHQERQQRVERLEWEKELLEGDIWGLEQRSSACQRELLVDKAESYEQKHTKAEESILWRIPIIRGLLRWIRRIFWRKRKEKLVRKQEKYGQEAYGKEKHDQGGVAWSILQEQLEEKQTRLFNVKEELEEYQGGSLEERQLHIELKSILLAEETIRNVAGESYQDSRDAIQAAVSEIFSGITGGAYDGIDITEDGKLVLYGGKGQLEPWQLSRGTMEQLYFALRLGVGRCLMQEEPMPILLDETFCAYDERRLNRTLQWLARQQEQIILFTSQKRELNLLEEAGVAHSRILL